MATVLSTIKGTLEAFALFDISDKSKTSSFGLPKDSAKNALVFSCTASAKFSGFEGSTNVVVIPSLGNVTPVAQLDRVLGFEPRGREFESSRAHHI